MTSALCGGRFQIDASYNLIIQAVTPADAGVYSCRSRNHRLGIRLFVHCTLSYLTTATSTTNVYFVVMLHQHPVLLYIHSLIDRRSSLRVGDSTWWPSWNEYAHITNIKSFKCLYEYEKNCQRVLNLISSFQFYLRLVFKQVAQLSQRDRATWWVSYGQKWKTGTGRQYFTDIIDLFNHCDVIGQQSNRIRRKTQNKGCNAVQDHSRSSRSVSIESPYAASY